MRTGLGERMKTRPYPTPPVFRRCRNEMPTASTVSLPPPGGFMGKREPQTILKTEERSIHVELGRERTFNR